ncbi:hypothetical protein SO802_016781 [Lithocarpus litseifolius]|uniref:Uncharacterized protein n=1 Tax=Lithocarpus litseifolius TaxID=425828 RepID=A0AAW2CXH5_9ROSI
MAAVTSKVSLKLMIDTETRRVLYAEAGKDFVDFLFYILALPTGTFIPLLNQEMLGSLGNIYDSIENLSTSYLRPNVTKDSLLKPRAYFSAGTGLPLHLPNVESSRKLYRCYCQNVSHNSKTFCLECKSQIYIEQKYIGPPCANDPYSSTVGDYVKEKVTYMVMDDLAVKPFSTTSLTTLLNKLNVKDIGALEEKVVDLGTEEVVKLLKALLTKSSILTDVFLPILKDEVNCQQEVRKTHVGWEWGMLGAELIGAVLPIKLAVPPIKLAVAADIASARDASPDLSASLSIELTVPSIELAVAVTIVIDASPDLALRRQLATLQLTTLWLATLQLATLQLAPSGDAFVLRTHLVTLRLPPPTGDPSASTSFTWDPNKAEFRAWLNPSDT